MYFGRHKCLKSGIPDMFNVIDLLELIGAGVRNMHKNPSTGVLALQSSTLECNITIRLPALYSTDDGSRLGCFFHVGGKKIKNKNSWPADVGGKKK